VDEERARVESVVRLICDGCDALPPAVRRRADAVLAAALCGTASLFDGAIERYGAGRRARETGEIGRSHDLRSTPVATRGDEV